MCDYIIVVLSICEVRTDSSCAVPVPMWEWSTDGQFLCSSCTDVRVKYGRTVLVQFLYRCDSEVRTDSSRAILVMTSKSLRCKFLYIFAENTAVTGRSRTLLLLAGREHCCYWQPVNTAVTGREFCCYWPKPLLLLRGNTAVAAREQWCYWPITLLLLRGNTAVAGR